MIFFFYRIKRYGKPSIAQGIQQLKTNGCKRLIVLPLYPQYSGTTSASIYDEVFQQLQRYRHVPTLRIIQPYYCHPAYISALATVTKSVLDAQPIPVEVLLMSFHGIPERYHLRGDPYPYQCEVTAKALAKELNLDEDKWLMSYQSVFGRDPWLLPATNETVANLAQQGESDFFGGPQTHRSLCIVHHRHQTYCCGLSWIFK